MFLYLEYDIIDSDPDDCCGVTLYNGGTCGDVVIPIYISVSILRV